MTNRGMWERHIGSSIAMALGGLMFVSGLAQPNGGTITGPVIVLGVLAYRSAKERWLGQVKPTKLRRFLEVAGVMTAVLMIVLQNNLIDRLTVDPAVYFVLPVWILVAYAIIGFRAPRVLDATES